MTEQWHKQQYEQALASVDYKGPAWEDLTEQQRENIRSYCNWRAFARFV